MTHDFLIYIHVMIIPTTLFFPSYRSHTRKQMNLGVKEAKEETKLKVKEMTA